MQKKKRKTIGKIIAWTLLAAILYLGIGATVPFLHTKTIENTKEADEQVRLAMTDRETPDRAAILETNQSAWDERIRLIQQAKSEIILATFDMRLGESTSDILSLLYQKADEGVHVRILVDGISGFLRFRNDPLFSTVASHEQIEIRIYNELNAALPWKSMGCMHDKYLIVDSLAYILGGRNTFDYFIGNYETKGRSLDREMLIYNTSPQNTESSVYDLIEYFEKIWDYDECSEYNGDDCSTEEQDTCKTFLKERYTTLKSQNPSLFDSYDYTANTVETKGVTLFSNETHIYAKEPTVFYELTQLMKQAKKEVYLHTPYAVLDQNMEDAISQVCRQAPVTLMVNAIENGDNLVASSDYIWHRQDVLDTGVTLLEYMGGTSYHGKSLVIDEEIAIVGSYNLDMRSTYVDTELMLVVRGEEISKELKDHMETLHRDCRKINKDGSEETPLSKKEQHLSGGQKVLLRSLGFIMQAFRVFV